MSNPHDTGSDPEDWSDGWLRSQIDPADVQLAYDRFVPAVPPPDQRPEGVRHLVPRVLADGKTVWDSYSCRVVFRGELDGMRLWQAVSTRWMHPGDRLEIDFLPPKSEVLGPPMVVASDV